MGRGQRHLQYYLFSFLRSICFIILGTEFRLKGSYRLFMHLTTLLSLSVPLIQCRPCAKLVLCSRVLPLSNQSKCGVGYPRIQHEAYLLSFNRDMAALLRRHGFTQPVGVISCIKLSI